jgi:cation diffusion facilitator family transporter
LTEPSRDFEARASTGSRATIQTVFVSTFLAIVKILAGSIGNSYALIADGIESVLDIVGSLVVWGGLRIAARPADGNHPYGHGKAESLAAMVVSLGLLAAALALAVQSVREILTPHHGPAAFTLAVLVLVVITKELLFRRLARIGLSTASTALQVDAWHHRSDALTSAAAFVGISVALVGGAGYETADDWAALAACGVIGWNGIRLLRVSIREVMDAAAPETFLQTTRSIAAEVSGVLAIEKCIARKSGPGWFIEIHVEVDGMLPIVEGHAIGHRVKDRLCTANMAVLDVLVHVEPAPRGGTEPSVTS